MKFFLTFFLLSALNLSNLSAKDNNTRLSLGTGVFNVMNDGTPPHNDQSGMVNLEIQNGKKFFNYLRPFLGILGSNAGTYYAYGGFGIDSYFTKKKNWVLTPAVACGYYKDGSEIKAGNHMEFYIGIDLFYRFRNNVRVGLGIFHISNADSGYRNPGSETLVLKYQVPIE